MNTVTQTSVTAVLGAFEGIAENVRRIKASVAELYNAVLPLSEKGGFKVEPSDTNFIYVRFDDKSRGELVWSELHKRSISVRVMNGCLRITAGTDGENGELIRAFGEIIAAL